MPVCACVHPCMHAYVCVPKWASLRMAEDCILYMFVMNQESLALRHTWQTALTVEYVIVGIAMMLE